MFGDLKITKRHTIMIYTFNIRRSTLSKCLKYFDKEESVSFLRATIKILYD